jgi:predicted DNA-binding transcriptional regulator AlpA
VDANNLEFMRLPAVLERLGESRSVFLREVDSGLAPPPVKVGRCVFWPRHEISEVMAARLNAAQPEQLRRLVGELIARRRTLIPASMREASAA